MRKQKNNAKGITLVALVITIIVLVILVGVTLSTAMNTGLIDNSKKAVTANKEEAIKEAATIIYADWHIRKQKGDTTVGEDPLEYIKAELEKQEFDRDLIAKIQISNGKILINEFSYVKSIAHAAYSLNRYPQSSIVAYQAAIDNDFEYLECDVSFTSDGVIVISHNATINEIARNIDGTELTETVTIAETTYEELLTYDYGIYAGSQYAGTKILTFDDFMAFCKEKQVKPYVELKNLISGQGPANVEAVLSVIERYGMEEQTTIMAFSQYYCELVKQANDSIRLGWLRAGVVTEEQTITVKGWLTGNNEVFISTSDYSSESVSVCKSANIPLEVYVINDMSIIKNLDSYISGVTSDYYNASKVLFYDKYNNGYEIVKVISANELKNNKGLTNLPISNYTYISTGRLAYTEFDIPVEFGYLYKIEFTSTVDTAQVGTTYYTQKALDLISQNENIEGHYYDTGWKSSGYVSSTVVPFYDGYNYAALRMQFRDSASTETEDYITSVTISRIRVQ